jgi:hypothetical protein
MELTDEQLNKVAEMAGLLFKISDIAIMIDVDTDVLREEITDKHTEVSKRYYHAKLEVIGRLRKQEIEQAELGSNTSIELVSKYINEQKHDE